MKTAGSTLIYRNIRYTMIYAWYTPNTLLNEAIEWSYSCRWSLRLSSYCAQFSWKCSSRQAVIAVVLFLPCVTWLRLRGLEVPWEMTEPAEPGRSGPKNLSCHAATFWLSNCRFIAARWFAARFFHPMSLVVSEHLHDHSFSCRSNGFWFADVVWYEEAGDAILP